LREQASAIEVFVRVMRGYAAVTRELNAQLVADHDLTLNDYEALLHLARADERRMRRVDLAQRLLLTASGVTRLLDGLERAGYVDRDSCASDRRVTYAVLTDAGLAKLRTASKSHVADIRAFFETRFSEEELDQLVELLDRLPLEAEPLDTNCTA
jgi:DNA-binding MarR family transcriptional regulator